MLKAALVAAVLAQAVEVRSARLVLPSGDERSVDGGVWVSEPEFSRYVAKCVACQADAARPAQPMATPAGYLIALGSGLLLGFVGALVLWVSLRAP